MPSACAVVIGIENYQQPGIHGVQFAHGDAKAFRDLLVKRLEVPEENAELWLDHEANRTHFEEELKYIVKQLGPDDKFYFFYAGHGLWAKGGNRLTAWDTHLSNLPGTTIDLEDVLLGPLREGDCKQSTVFIDACAADLDDATLGRDLLSEMSKREFEEFIAASDYTAAFFSCSPKEKSYSSPLLNHGIWTYHLLRALAGEEPAAVVRDEWITGESLQNYLKDAVRKFIRGKMSITGRQRPYALIGSSGTFPLARIPEPATTADLPCLKPDFAGGHFGGEESRPFKNLPGFTRKKNHTVPTDWSDSASNWARRLLKDEIAEELQTVYQNAKDVLQIKSREIDKQEDTGGGTVDTEVFRFAVEAAQSEEDPGEAIVRREIRLRVPHSELPDEFDDIFPNPIDEFVVSMPGSNGKFGALIDKIEDAAEVIGADVTSDPTKGLIELRLSSGTRITIETKREVMTIRHPGITGCSSMIAQLGGDDVKNLMGKPPKMIGRRN